MLSTEFRSFRVDQREFSRQRRAVLRRKLRLFGWGSRGPGLYGIGPARWLVGRRVRSSQVARSRGPRVRLRGERWLRVALPGFGFLPTHVQGAVVGGRPGGGRRLAVAMNGTIVATGYTFSLRGSRTESVSVMVPEESLQLGRNRLQVLEVGPRGRLTLLGSAG